jgi:hypothetical protein
LIELASAKPQLRRWLKEDRALLNFAEPGKEAALADALLKEELAEREVDRRYWAPLKKELEQLRLTRGRKSRG